VSGRVVFLDRDGVINRDSPDYIKSWKEFTFLPGSLTAIRDLTRAGYRLILITNQSAVNRGMVSWNQLRDMHSRMRAAIRECGGNLTDIFFCPHHPDEGCDCRKPKPGMIRNAQARYSIDLDDAVMVGDSAKDMQCAENAGCGGRVLVLTGNGAAARERLARENRLPDFVAENLLDAAEWILNRP
jgi:D-glycero-D-manno-heptose 1,7-bisphosphate phosphatase